MIKPFFFLALLLFSISGLSAQEFNASWDLKETPVKASLRGLSVVSEKVVWASGSRGTWLLTTDGGESWNHGVIGGLDSVDFRSIHAFDAQIAVAVSAGQPAVIYKTKDAGATWRLKSTQSASAFLDGVSFIDDQRGFVFGDPVDGKWMILSTKDGGESWEQLDEAPEVTEGEAGFAASASSLVASEANIWIGSGGTVSNIWHSSDDGITWNNFPSPLLQGEPSQGIFAMCLVDDQRLVAVGGDYLKPEEKKGSAGVFFSTEGEWSLLGGNAMGYRSGITYLKSKKWVIATGTNGSDISLDQGESWTTFSSEGFHAVKVDTRGRWIWASGAGGKIARLNVQ